MRFVAIEPIDIRCLRFSPHGVICSQNVGPTAWGLIRGDRSRVGNCVNGDRDASTTTATPLSSGASSASSSSFYFISSHKV